MKDENLEECVHQQDSIGLDGRGVQEYRFRRSTESVGVQDRLDHDQALGQVLTKQARSGGEKESVTYCSGTVRNGILDS